MSYNGSGTFNINTAGQPVVTGTVISSTAFNALTSDLGTGLSTAITKDGQTTATARIPFAQGINSSLVTDATSTTTGSIITAGGVGIAKALYVGTTANIAGTTTLAGVTATSITDSGLTSGRVTYAGTAGLLQDSANLTFSGSVLGLTGSLTATGGVDKLTSATGVVSVAAATAPSVGQVLMATSGTVATWQTPATTNLASPGPIGNTTPSTGAFTTLSATGQISGTNNAAAQAVFRGWSSSGGAVFSNGQIQIGYALANCGILQYDDSGNTSVYLDSTYNSNGSYIKFRTKTNATPFDAMTIKGDGTVTMGLYGAGAATFSAAGVISSVSDETWKIKDGVPINPDAMLKKLEPGYWYYNDEKRETFGKDRQLGFYAQNVNSAIGPEAAPEPESYLSQDEDGKEITITKPWGYYDRSVLAVTVMSLQKALATIESLTARITALEAK